MTYRPLDNGTEATSPRANGTRIRGREVRGTVHDPGAAMMGGVAAAGLFSNAYDLAELAETWREAGSSRGFASCRKRARSMDQSGWRTATTAEDWPSTSPP